MAPRNRDTSETPPAKGELDTLLDEISKKHGSTVAHSGDKLTGFNLLPLDIFILDMALLGGLPESIINIFSGWESSGKSTMALKAAVSAQKKYPDKKVVWVDVEGTFDPIWAAMLGVNLSRLVVIHPDFGEHAVDLAEAMLKVIEVSLVVVDSIAALIPIKQQEASASDSHMALHARLVQDFMTKITSCILTERKRGHSVTVIAINQLRSKAGFVMGNPIQMAGGNAIKFYAGTHIRFSNKEVEGTNFRDIKVITYNTHSFSILKNKTGNSIRSGEFDLIRSDDNPLGIGFIDDAKTVVTYAKKFGLITGGGSAWRLDGLDQKFPNADSICNYLYQNREFFISLKARMIQMHRESQGVSALPPDGVLQLC